MVETNEEEYKFYNTINDNFNNLENMQDYKTLSLRNKIEYLYNLKDQVLSYSNYKTFEKPKVKVLKNDKKAA